MLTEENITILDAYRATPTHPPVVQHLATISVPMGPTSLRRDLQPLYMDLWNRRTNLTGLKIRCVVLDVSRKCCNTNVIDVIRVNYSRKQCSSCILQYEPFVSTTLEPDGSVTMTGPFAEIWYNVQEQLGFK